MHVLGTLGSMWPTPLPIILVDCLPEIHSAGRSTQGLHLRRVYLGLVVVDSVREVGEEGEIVVLVDLEAGVALAEVLPPALHQEHRPCQH